MQRSLILLFRLFPLWLMYGLMALVIPFYALLDGRARKASYRFARRLGYGRLRSALHVLSNMFNMGTLVMDRFGAYAGKRFKLVSDTMPLYDRLSEQEGGFMLLSSHLGHFEMAGYMFHSRKTTYALVFGGETATVMQNRSRMFGIANVRMVPVSDDLSHIFTLSGALADGQIVSIPADRALGSPKQMRCPFLGQDAAFPAGPFTLAVQREVPVLAVFVMKESIHTYRVILEELPAAGSRESLAEAYSAALERMARRYPAQWYNFYDFWAA